MFESSGISGILPEATEVSGILASSVMSGTLAASGL